MMTQERQKYDREFKKKAVELTSKIVQETALGSLNF